MENEDFNLDNIAEIEDNFTVSMWVIADKDNELEMLQFWPVVKK